MPPDGKLSEAQIRDLMRWVNEGAPHPEAGEVDENQSSLQSAGDVSAEHWAFEPLFEPQLPEVSNSQWPRSDLDRFVLRRLEDVGIEPAPPAEAYPKPGSKNPA